MKCIITFIFLAYNLTASAHTIDSLVMKMVHGSSTHRLLKAQNEAAIAANHSTLSLADPSVGYNHLWGSPHDVGQRNDISISQSFDYATISGTKRKEAVAKDRLADAVFDRSTLSLQQEIMLLVVDIATANAINKVYAERIALSEKLVETCRKRITQGDANKLDLSKATLSLATIRANAIEAETSRQQLFNSPFITTTLNDGERAMLLSITTDMAEQTIKRLAPLTRVSEAETEEMLKQVSVANAELNTARKQNLPELTAGFMAELTREEKFRGISIGVNIPLWNNSSRIRSAKAQVIAIEAENQQKQEILTAKLQQYRQLCLSTKQQFDEMKHSLAIVSDTNRLLQKAYDAGELSIVDYLLEQESYYDLRLRYLDVLAKHLTAICLCEGK